MWCEFSHELFNKLSETGSNASVARMRQWWVSFVIQHSTRKVAKALRIIIDITLFWIVSETLYGYIFNKLLREWVEQHRLIHEVQTGYRPNFYSITFLALDLAQRQILNHCKLLADFIDLKKAFDLIDWISLWAVLNKNSQVLDSNVWQNGLKSTVYLMRPSYAVILDNIIIRSTKGNLP